MSNEHRAKYSADDLKKLGGEGKALKNPSGDWSYPIDDKEDLENAIHAVGRGSGDHNAIRKHIIAQAKKLGLSKLIPDNWAADGSLSEGKSADADAEQREEPTPEDWSVSYGLQQVKKELAGVKAKQLADPDNKTDPDDKDVMKGIEKAEKAIDKTIEAQGKDGRPDERAATKQCPTCSGTGKILEGHRTCPDCHGSGTVPSSPQGESQGGAVRHRKARHRAVPLVPEVRYWRAEGLEVRSSTKTDEIIITGSPIVYDTPYTVRDIFGEFEERMLPGAVTSVLARGADVRFLFNHDGLPLARTISGTLALSDSPTALRMEARLDARQQMANDLAIATERGDVSQMSVGMIVGRDTWGEREEWRDVEQLADLLDVSAVTYPASPTTQLQIAQRMVMDIPVESRARVRRLYADLRAGKVLSKEHQDHLVDAAKAIHTVLGHAGFDPHTIGQEEDEGRGAVEAEPIQGGESGNGTTEDGTIGGNVAGDNSPGYNDGTGARSDPGEPIRTPNLSALSLQIEARKRRRKVA